MRVCSDWSGNKFSMLCTCSFTSRKCAKTQWCLAPCLQNLFPPKCSWFRLINRAYNIRIFHVPSTKSGEIGGGAQWYLHEQAHIVLRTTSIRYDPEF